MYFTSIPFPFTDNVNIDTCATYQITSSVTVTVKLANGFSLTSLISNSSLPVSPITVQSLIQQEFRRAVVLSSQNAQLITTNYYILAETIIAQLLSSLSASSVSPGIYAQILANVSLTLVDPIGFVVPNPTTSNMIIYDILPASITVVAS